jgi:hypothetical protein
LTHAAAYQALLDAGYVPEGLCTVAAPPDAGWQAAAEPLLRRLGLHPGRALRHLGASHYVIRAAALAEAAPVPAGPPEPLSLVACVADEAVLRANLLASPCLGPGSPHEVLLLRGCPSAADGLNRGLELARHRVVVCVHQDVYLPLGWPERFLARWGDAERAYGAVGAAGVHGVARRGHAVMPAGHVVDRECRLCEAAALPAVVDTLDELLLAVPRATPVRFDPRLGWHLYGADYCLAARQHGLAVVAVDAPCFHHSQTVELTPAFGDSAAALAGKWAGHLPIATSCAVIDDRWRGARGPGAPAR